MRDTKVDLRGKRKLLIYRIGSLGDTVVALPCFHRIASAAPNAERVVLTNFPVNSKAPALEAVLGGSGLIHRCIEYPIGSRSIGRLLKVQGEIRQFGAETLIYLAPSRGLVSVWRDLLFFRAAGIREVIGAPVTRDLQRHRPLGSGGEIEFECMRLARCLSPLGEPGLDDPENWNLHLTQAEQDHAKSILAPLGWGKPFLSINMGGKFASKDWGENNWQSLCTRLSQRYPRWGVLIVGAPEDAARADRVSQCWIGPTINACGRLTPRESAVAIGQAEAFIGHDSGPMHLAAAAGVPCIGLFDNLQPPNKWHPYGTRCRAIHGATGVKDIQAQQVMDILATLIDASPKASVSSTEAMRG